MSKIKTLAIGLGVVASLGVAVLPLAAYADPGDYPVASKDLLVNLIVDPVISMTIKSYSGDPAALNGTTDCAYDESVSSSVCTTTGDQKVYTMIAPGEVDNTTMYSDIFVSTNSTAGYTLKLIDADEVTSLVATGGYTIDTTNAQPSTSNPGWAVYTTDTTADNPSTWLAMPNNVSATDPTIVAGTPITIANYTPVTATVTHERQSTVHYGVAAKSDQVEGLYTDTVMYIATAK